MRLTKSIMLAAGAVLALSACENDKKGDQATSPPAKEAAGDETLAKGIPADSKMGAALKAAGLDATLAGPGPYTVLAPDDAAFDKFLALAKVAGGIKVSGFGEIAEKLRPKLNGSAVKEPALSLAN